MQRERALVEWKDGLSIDAMEEVLTPELAFHHVSILAYGEDSWGMHVNVERKYR